MKVSFCLYVTEYSLFSYKYVTDYSYLICLWNCLLLFSDICTVEVVYFGLTICGPLVCLFSTAGTFLLHKHE